MVTIILSTKVATWHYKTYKGDHPLYIIYSLLGAIIWATVLLAVAEYFST
jgi:hypothetical protein